MFQIFLAIAAVVSFLFTPSVFSQIVIGQSADFTKETANQVKEYNRGAQAYFDEINNSGGINGKRINYVSVDDARNTTKVVENTVKLIADGASLLLGYRGTELVNAALKAPGADNVAFLAPMTGATNFYDVSKHQNTFMIRSSYVDELNEAIEWIRVFGKGKRVAIYFQDDAYGRPLVEVAETAIKKSGNLLVLREPYDRTKSEVSPEVTTKFLQVKPEFIFAFCNPAACKNFIGMMSSNAVFKQLGYKPFIVQNSISDLVSEYAAYGARIAGSPTTVSIPSFRSGVPVAGEYRQLMNARKQSYSLLSYEGFLAAKTAVIALKKAKSFSAPNVLAYLQSAGTIDLGGFTLTYTPSDRSGSKVVRMISINSQGKNLE